MCILDVVWVMNYYLSTICTFREYKAKHWPCDTGMDKYCWELSKGPLVPNSQLMTHVLGHKLCNITLVSEFAIWWDDPFAFREEIWIESCWINFIISYSFPTIICMLLYRLWFSTFQWRSGIRTWRGNVILDTRESHIEIGIGIINIHRDHVYSRAQQNLAHIESMILDSVYHLNYGSLIKVFPYMTQLGIIFLCKNASYQTA